MPIIDQARWGICGFVSVLNGLRTAGLLTKLAGGKREQLTLNEIQTRLYAELVTYLKYLVFTNSPLVKEIEDFTRHLLPSQTITIPQTIVAIETRLRNIASVPGRNESTIRAVMRGLIQTTRLNIAMTPDSLVDYMEWAGVKNARNLQVVATQNTSSNLRGYKNCVIGLGDGLGWYNGLKHWIYVDRDGVLNNWGKKTKIGWFTKSKDLFGERAMVWAIFITHVIKMA